MAVLNRSIPRAQEGAQLPAWTRLRPILAVTCTVVVVIAVLQVVQSQLATDASFQIQQLEQDKLELETGLRELEAEVASLSSLARVRGEAEGLGLGPAQARDAVTVSAPPPQSDEQGLPTRFVAGEAQQSKDAQGSSWWRDLLDVLPFN